MWGWVGFLLLVTGLIGVTKKRRRGWLYVAIGWAAWVAQAIVWDVRLDMLALGAMSVYMIAFALAMYRAWGRPKAFSDHRVHNLTRGALGALVRDVYGWNWNTIDRLTTIQLRQVVHTILVAQEH